jgi:hypothetical protein
MITLVTCQNFRGEGLLAPTLLNESQRWRLPPCQLSGTVYSMYLQLLRSRDSVVGIATSYGLDQEFSLLQIVQTSSEVHPTSYPMGTGGSFPGGKAAGA